jgi:hypothetical protein
METLEQRLMSGEPPVLLLDQDRSYWELLIELGWLLSRVPNGARAHPTDDDLPPSVVADDSVRDAFQSRRG